MTDNVHAVRKIAWREICPWLLIFRTFTISVSLAALSLATAATLLVPLGWSLSDLLFRPDLSAATLPWTEKTAQETRRPYHPPTSLGELVAPAVQGATVAERRFLGSWRHVLVTPPTLRETAYRVFGALWTILVWAFFAGAITRIAVVRMGRDEHVTLFDALRHAGRKYGSYIGAPLFLSAVILLGIGGLWLVSLLFRANVGVVIAGLLWPLLLLVGLGLTILIIGLALGWPFMWVAVSAELDGDFLAAVSRGYTYTFQRPLRYLAYAVLALTLGALGWIAVYHFTELAIRICQNSVYAVTSPDRFSVLLPWFGAPTVTETTDSTSLRLGMGMVALANQTLRTIATAYGFSFFFCAASAIYLLLRFDIEQTEFDEVFVEEEEESLRLPPLTPPVAPTGDSETPPAVGDSGKT
jgi:hypothetical protein